MRPPLTTKYKKLSNHAKLIAQSFLVYETILLFIFYLLHIPYQKQTISIIILTMV